ncbi:hypothetical protein X975_01200, partial [Stegodyphus mimosarum]
MSPDIWIVILMFTCCQLHRVHSRLPYHTFQLSKRQMDGSSSERDNVPYSATYDSPGLMNNYLTFLSHLAKKDVSTDDRTIPDARSPKRDNRKFQ